MAYIICMRKRFSIPLGLALMVSWFGCAGPIKSERLDTLLELKSEQGALDDTLAEETKNFDRLRNALEKKEIQKGDSKEAVRLKAGEPVVIYREKRRIKWVYKEIGFKGPKIYLFFNPAGKLSDYKCLRTDCESS